jgi:2-polyprenyl-3-methyl-5-hydroxy-6-metoxy-1,4-benzoquinol methylase
MTTDIHQSYQGNPEFWRKDSPRLQGDLEQRPKAVEMLGDISEKHILEAGCGSGYVARMIARKGAFTYGIDISEEMLKIALESERENVFGILYKPGDITRSLDPFIFTRSNDPSFHGICCVGVVHHLSPEDYVSFLIQVRGVLKKDSPLVISVIHPSMFYPTSPARTQERCFNKLFPLEDKPMDQSQQFREELYDVDGNHFDSLLWYKPTSFLVNALNENGFRIEQVNEPIFRKEHMLTPLWGDNYGYPTHLQIRAVKDGGQIK